MSEATVRAAIVTLVEGISNVGNVYNREPLTTNWDTFLDKFKVTISSVDQIRGFTVSCEAIPSEGFIAAGARDTGLIDNYQFVIRGYCSLNFDNATETDFLAVCLNVRDALNGGIISGSVFNADPAQITAYVPRLLGSVLCHYCEITQIVREKY